MERQKEELEELIYQAMPEHADKAIKLFTEIIDEATIPVPDLVMTEGRTKGDWNITLPWGMREGRPDDTLSTRVINEMLKSGVIRFVLEMKRSQMVSPFRNRQALKVFCPADKELEQIAEAALEVVLPQTAYEFSWSSLVYGTAFMEQLWENRTSYELGVSKNKTSKIFTVPKVPNLVPYETVTEILRTPRGQFNGFIQMADYRLNPFPQGNAERPGEVEVRPEHSLVLPYMGFSRNLWGESYLKPLYPIWFWYEILLRSAVRFAELMGDPPRLGRAPSRKKVRKSDGTFEDAISYLLALSTTLSKSSAVVIPSDVDSNSTKYEWELDYMQMPERTQPFVDILEMFTQMILRAGLTGDRALTQGATGSYAIGEIHAEATALHNDMVVTSWVHYLNRYWISNIALYNKGVSPPHISLEIRGLDPREREFFTSILGIAGNSESFQEFFYRLDWESLGKMSGLPMFTEEQAEQLKKKLFDEKMDHQEQQMAMAKKFGEGSDTVKGVTDGANTEKQALEDLVSKYRGMVLYDNELQRLATERPFDESLVKRDNSGRFAKNAGRIAISDETKVGPELLAKVNELEEPERSRVLSLLANTPKYATPEEAIKGLAKELESLGIDIPDGVVYNPDLELREGALGRYDDATNSFTMSADMAEAIQKGDPLATHIMAHELAHSAQGGADRPLNEGESYALDPNGNPVAIVDSDKALQIGQFKGISEGTTDLIGMAAVSKIVGKPVTTKEMAVASSILNGGEANIGVGYPSEAALAAKNYLQMGGNTKRVITDAHAHGEDMTYQRKLLEQIYEYPKYTSGKDLWPKPNSGGTQEDILKAVEALMK